MKPDFVTQEMVDYLKDIESGFTKQLMEMLVRTIFALSKQEAHQLVEWYYEVKDDKQEVSASV